MNVEMDKTLAEVRVSDLPPGIASESEGLQLREQSGSHLLNYGTNIRTIPSGDYAAVCGNQVHEPSKCEFHRCEISINVGMVKFNVIDNRQFRKVVHKLRTLIEVRSVILVCFNDEVFALGNAKTRTKVLRNPTN